MENIEMLNRVTLRGIVGTAQHSVIKGRHLTRFLLMTTTIADYEDGEYQCESTWHSVTAWDCEVVEKGDKVEVVGRLRNLSCKTVIGDYAHLTDIVASEVRKLTEIGDMTYERAETYGARDRA